MIFMIKFGEQIPVYFKYNTTLDERWWALHQNEIRAPPMDLGMCDPMLPEEVKKLPLYPRNGIVPSADGGAPFDFWQVIDDEIQRRQQSSCEQLNAFFDSLSDDLNEANRQSQVNDSLWWHAEGSDRPNQNDDDDVTRNLLSKITQVGYAAVANAGCEPATSSKASNPPKRQKVARRDAGSHGMDDTCKACRGAHRAHTCAKKQRAPSDAP